MIHPNFSLPAPQQLSQRGSYYRPQPKSSQYSDKILSQLRAPNQKQSFTPQIIPQRGREQSQNLPRIEKPSLRVATRKSQVTLPSIYPQSHSIYEPDPSEKSYRPRTSRKHPIDPVPTRMDYREEITFKPHPQFPAHVTQIRLKTPSKWRVTENSYDRLLTPTVIKSTITTSDRYKLNRIEREQDEGYEPYSVSSYKTMNLRYRHMILPRGLGASENDKWREESEKRKRMRDYSKKVEDEKVRQRENEIIIHQKWRS